jgi:hypothetical protein
MNLDRTLANIARLVRQFVGNEIVGPRVDYLAAYPCVAVTQNLDGSLELQPDDTRIAPVSNVPIRLGTPGITATVANGARVLLQWTGGDPTKPVATLWEMANVQTMTLAVAGQLKLGDPNAFHRVIFGDDFSTVGGAFDTLIKGIATAVGTIPGGGSASTAITTALTTYQTTVAASKLSTNTVIA